MNIKDYIWEQFDFVVAYDYEYSQTPGNNPNPVCVTYKDLKTGKITQQWLLGRKQKSLFPVASTLFICHYAVAEVSCDIVRGITKPTFIFDSFVEEKKMLNGKIKVGFGLLDTCERYNIKGVMSEAHKTLWRDTIINNFPNYSDEEQQGILKYNLEDVLTNEKLFYAQLEKLSFKNNNYHQIVSQACFHGRSMGVCAQIEHNGIPVNLEIYNDLDKHYEEVKKLEIDSLTKVFDCYDGDKFSNKKFAAAIEKEGLLERWPKTEKGRLKTDDRTIYRFAEVSPAIQQYRASKFIIESRKLKGYEIGKDGRSRTSLNMFGQSTGRTNVSTATNPFGAPRRMRTMIGTTKDKILVYADFKSQEAVIQAQLSQDQNMIAAVKSGDPYLHTAKLVGAIPQDATRKSHEKIREIYKQSFLAISYGQTPFGLKNKLGVPIANATYIHAAIIKAYSDYQIWIQSLKDFAMRRGYLITKYGWRYWLSDRELVNPRQLGNWPIQSHGSEILRRAMIELDDAGFEISMIIHDAILIHMDRKDCRIKIEALKKIMSAAAYEVIGSEIEVDSQLIKETYQQKGEHKEMWDNLYEKLLKVKKGGVR
jgi:DNA polymerase I-like protein with 3'-5' exonuclease and polymerase domains